MQNTEHNLITDSVVLKEQEARGTFVIIPALNEERVIRETVQKLLALGVHVVVVDDGSSDGTLSQLQGLPINVLHHAINLGQGAALQTGIDFAVKRDARFIVTFDADGQHEERDIPRLINTLIEHNLDVVLGSRFLGKATGIGIGRRLLLKVAIIFTWLTLGMRLTDIHNGLRAFRANIADRIRITQNRMAHASELLNKIKEAGLKYIEIPTIVRYSDYSKEKGQSGLELVNILYDLIIKRLFR